MGTAKALLPFRNGTLIEAVIARASPQVARLAIDVPRRLEPEYRRRLGGEILPDLFDETLGPLCGIATGLAWLEGDRLAVFPCDTPFPPPDLVAQLAAAAQDRPAVARHGGRIHSVCGLWPKTVLAPLLSGIADGSLRSVMSALRAFGGREVDIAAPEHAFFNVNTREDLARAETL